MVVGADPLVQSGLELLVVSGWFGLGPEVYEARLVGTRREPRAARAVVFPPNAGALIGEGLGRDSPEADTRSA